jgi:hypothetical protein
MLGGLLKKMGSLAEKAWLGGVYHGVVRTRKGVKFAKKVGKAAPGWAQGHPKSLMAGAGVAAGAVGYMTGEGTTGQRLERGLGFATVAALGVNPKFRGAAVKQFKTADRAIGMYGLKKGLGAVGARAFGGIGGTGRMAAVGAMYGAFDDDTTILGGAAAGAGIGILGKGAMRAHGRYIEKNPVVRQMLGMSSRVESKLMTIRHGAAAGGAVGMVAGGPVGMVAGAGIGGAVGGIARFATKYPTASKYAAGTAFVGGASAAIVGGAAANAYSMHQRPSQTNFGADGDLALGLHSLRHG